MVDAKFVGGPRHGQVKQYQGTPRVVACNTEATKAGMFGLYRVDTKKLPGEVVMVWRELPKHHR